MKHFLDTSVARKILLGSAAYRKYFDSQFGKEPCYASAYVAMEVRRSFLRHAIAFYAMLQLPHMKSVADAISLWSNKFRSSELKAIMDLIAELMRMHALKGDSVGDKRKVIQALGCYIVRIDTKLRRNFKYPGRDTTHCARAEAALTWKENEDIGQALDRFVRAFDDVETCRNKCSIDNFFLRRYRTEVERYGKIASKLPENSESCGFHNIVSELEEVLQEGASVCSCKRCEAIGDAVIALDAPRDMRLEHIDKSFNHLCPPVGQDHFHHPSEAAMLNSGAAAAVQRP